MPSVYGQTDALAVAVVERINTCGTLSLPVLSQRRYRLLDPLTNIPTHENPVSVLVAPGIERIERQGISTSFAATYTLHIAIQQQISGVADEEAQCAILMRIRSEIIDDLCRRKFDLVEAAHPVYGAFVVQVESAIESGRTALPYNLARLLTDHVFESDTIVTFRAPA